MTTPSPAPDARELARRGWPWVVLWILTRCRMLHSYADGFQHMANDVHYYFTALNQHDPHARALLEYPLPVVWLLDLLRVPVAGNEQLYVVVFSVAMAALDAAFALWLWQAHSRLAAAHWIIFGFAMGPLLWFRYDVIAGVVVGAGLLTIATHPRLSGSLVALGAGIKLWPGVLLSVIAGRSRSSIARMVTFVLTGLVLVALVLLDTGWARLVSPLGFQSERGLQIESIWASVPMWHHAFDGPASGWEVKYSQFNAYQVYGPSVGGWLKASSASMVLALLFAAGVALLTWRRHHTPADVRAMAGVALVAWLLMANKTLSPQYVVWLGAAASAWLALAPRGRARWQAGALAVLTVLLAAATQYVYPLHYGDLVGAPGTGGHTTVALVLRNLGVVAIALLTSWWTISRLLADEDSRGTVEPDII